MKMRAARMYAYKEPLRLETIPLPDIAPDEVRVKVGGAGMCRTDFQLVDGYFRPFLGDAKFPMTLGHEVAGYIEGIGRSVPREAGLAEGDQVVVSGSQGDGSCRQCHTGNEQICAHGRWVGFGEHGGYAEYVPVNYRYLIKVPKTAGLTPEVLAPLTDAGITPYRGVKKLQAAGVLTPGRVIGVMGAGGLGGYAVQYAKFLGGGATIVVFGRSDDKLAVSKKHGADHIINIRGKTASDVRAQLLSMTGHAELDGVIDCVGADDTIRLGFDLLATQGAIVSVGLVGTEAKIPLFPFVAREFSYHGSFWGNFNDLSEIIALAQQGVIQHSIKCVNWEDINPTLEALGKADFVGRAVIVYD